MLIASGSFGRVFVGGAEVATVESWSLHQTEERRATLYGELAAIWSEDSGARAIVELYDGDDDSEEDYVTGEILIPNSVWSSGESQRIEFQGGSGPFYRVRDGERLPLDNPYSRR